MRRVIIALTLSLFASTSLRAQAPQEAATALNQKLLGDINNLVNIQKVIRPLLLKSKEPEANNQKLRSLQSDYEKAIGNLASHSADDLRKLKESLEQLQKQAAENILEVQIGEAILQKEFALLPENEEREEAVKVLESRLKLLRVKKAELHAQIDVLNQLNLDLPALILASQRNELRQLQKEAAKEHQDS